MGLKESTKGLLKRCTKQQIIDTEIRVLKALARFAILSLPALVLERVSLLPLQQAAARAVMLLLRNKPALFFTFDRNMMMSPALYLNGYVVVITSRCTGAFSAWLLFSLIFSFEGSWKKKLKWVLLGSAIIILSNIIRIALIMEFGMYNYDNPLWISLNLIAVALFLFYMKSLKAGAPKGVRRQ